MPSLIEGLRVVQGLRIVPVFVYRYSMVFILKKARSPGTTEGGRSDLGTRTVSLSGGSVVLVYTLDTTVFIVSRSCSFLASRQDLRVRK